MRTHIRIVLAAALIVSLVCAPALAGRGRASAGAAPASTGLSTAGEATSLPTLGQLWRRRMLRSLILRSQLVLLANVSGMQSQLVQKEWGQVIESDVTLTGEEWLKGSAAGPLALQGVLGGRIGDRVMQCDVSPLFQAGERALLFLQATEAQDGAGSTWSVVDGPEGRFHVDSQGNVPRLGMTWNEARIEILSYLTGARVYLPLIARGLRLQESEAEAQASSSPAVQAAAATWYDVFDDGFKWKGDSPTIDYYIYNPGFDGGHAGTVSQQNQAIQHAGQAWGHNGVGRANFRPVYKGTCAQAGAAEDGKNVVSVWNIAGSSGALACTFNFGNYLPGGNWWVESDIIFYDLPWTFSLDPAANPGTQDIQSVATHEFGHYVGLDHSAVPGSTMYAYYTGGTTYMRTLHLDDVAGELALYGAHYEVHDQEDVQDAEQGDRFGSSLAAGDFNDDGKQDLAVGVPYEDLGGVSNEGVVSIYLGTDGALDGWSSLSQISFVGESEANDYFGWSLAAGDFNHDGRDDLAVGVPYEDWQGAADAGVVYVFNGYPNPTVFAVPNRLDQAAGGGANEAGDRFGYTLAAGDFDHDGYDDLAVGTPYEDYGQADAGVVYVFRGSSTGLGRGYYLQQGTAGGTNEASDRFGAALAVGDFDHDGRDDLAVGTPGEDVSGVADAGAVYVFVGSSGTLGNGYRIDVRSLSPSAGTDRFGRGLAAGDVDGDGYDDLAVGAPLTDSSATDAGKVYVLRGKTGHMGASSLLSSLVPGASVAQLQFGDKLALADLNGDGSCEVIVGCPLGDGAAADEGRVYVTQLRDDSGHNELASLLLTQSPAATAAAGDQFGYALAVADYSGDGVDDLAIGVPYKDLTGATDAGKIFVWRDVP